MTRPLSRSFRWSPLSALVTIPCVVGTACAASVEDGPLPDGGVVDSAAPDGSSDGQLESSALDGGVPTGCDGAVDCENFPEACSDATLCAVTLEVDPRCHFQGLWASSPTDLWATGSLGTVVHYDGTKWSIIPTGRLETLRSVGGSGPEDVWIAASPAFILHTQGPVVDGGVTWDIFRDEPAQVSSCPMAAMWGTASGGMWTQGTCGTYSGGPGVLYSPAWEVDAGPSWTPDYSELVVTGRALIGFGEKDLWAVGVGGTFVHRVSDDDPTWVAVDSNSVGILNALWGSGADDIWIAGNAGTLRHWNGQMVEIVELDSSLAAANFLGIWGAGPHDLWLVGEDALIVHYDGEHFTRVPLGGLEGKRPTLRKVWASETTGEVWIVGDDVLLGGKTGAFL